MLTNTRLTRMVRRFAPLVLLALSAGAFAEQVELANGAVMQGTLKVSESTDEALAVELFETGGVVMVRWDHIEEGRRKQLRVDLGFEGEAIGEDVLVPGHEVLLANGNRDFGLALNEAQKDQPLRLQTATGEKSYPRDQVARVLSTQVAGLLVYTPAQLYQVLHDQAPPDSPRANKDLAVKCLAIGAFPQARTHLNAAKGDGEYYKLEGRVLDGLLRDLDILEKSAGARDLATQVELAIRSKRWNDARTKLDELAKQYTDETVRKKIGFGLLERKVIRGRDAYFKAELPRLMQNNLIKFVDQKVKERKPTRVDPDAPRTGANPGTLSEAKQWAVKALPKMLWEKAMADKGLTSEEMDEYWKQRSTRVTYNASYGTGSFIVAKKVAGPAAGGAGNRNDPNRPSRPPGSARAPDNGKGGPPKPAAVKERPMTEEEWWDILSERQGDRAKWLVAYFAENGGLFDVLRTDESEPIPAMDGVGTNVGGQTLTISGNIRKVTYR